MGRGISREAEWGIGVAFIVAMVIALILAIQAFQGPVSVILLVLGGLFLLVGLFFLTGTQRAPDEIGAMGAGNASTAAASEVAAPGGPQVAPSAPSFTPAAAIPSPQRALVVCPGCHMKVAQSFRKCPHCGTAL